VRRHIKRERKFKTQIIANFSTSNVKIMLVRCALDVVLPVRNFMEKRSFKEGGRDINLVSCSGSISVIKRKTEKG
jgi:hypothetical protein